MLKGLDVCVMSVGNQPGAPTIDMLERLVRRHGGRAVANPSPATFAIVAGRVTFKVRKYMETGRWDVVREDWLLRAGMERQLEPFRPEYILTATEPTRIKLTKQYDRYGDSYTRPITPTSFSALLNRMSGEEAGNALLPQLTDRELMNAEKTLLGMRIARKMRLFRGLTARLYLKQDNQEIIVAGEDQISLGVEEYRAQREMLQFVKHGGYWLRDSEPGVVQYVFVASTVDSLSDAEAWITMINGSDKDTSPMLLGVHWIRRSIEAGRLCDTADFSVRD
uniref:BRCT domain-containing protein n=1 Tax=Anopheles maculatus TaxID=74869 RepID=A0A182TAY1_9DIPT